MAPETVETPTSSPRARFDRKLMSYAGIGLLAGLVIGLIVGQNLPNGSGSTNSTVNSALLNQSATAQGKLVAIGDGKITLEADDGTRNEFPVSANVNIFVYVDKTSPATASADIQVLELNKQVLISLGVVGSEYQVTTITVLPPDNSATSSATPNR